MAQKITSNQHGQALITLVFFIAIAVTVITVSVVVLFSNSLATSATEKGMIAYYAAESGAQDGVLRLLRDPSYTGSYQISTFDQGLASVSIAGGTITATGSFTNTSVRKIRVQTVYTNGELSISSWEDIP